MAALTTGLPVDSDLADTLDDLAGIDPDFDDILNRIRALASKPHTTDQTQTLLSAIANPYGPDLTSALALLVQHLTNPTTNPSLRTLPAATQKEVQHLGEIHAFETAEIAPRDRTSEAAGLIAPS